MSAKSNVTVLRDFDPLSKDMPYPIQLITANCKSKDGWVVGVFDLPRCAYISLTNREGMAALVTLDHDDFKTLANAMYELAHGKDPNA